MKTRREFIRTMAVATTGLILPWGGVGATGTSAKHDRWGEILPLRKLGNTGESVTMLGVGGYHIGWTTERDAQEVIETAIQGGVRFFDTAHSYGRGVSEERYGKYLVPDYRDDIFLMTKSQARDGENLKKEFDLSLKRMQCDYVDLLQIHSLNTPEDVEQRIENGVIDAITEILLSGKTKYIGFTGHQSPYAHLKMLEHLQYPTIFSTIQLPVNLIDYESEHSFTRKVVPLALNKNMGLLAMKTLADGRFFSKKIMAERLRWETETPLIPGYITVKDAEFFAWSLPISVLITGAENTELLNEKISLAKEYSLLTETERIQMLEKVRQAPDLEMVEYYKKV